MKIYEDAYCYGWDGDNGVGERLISQMIKGLKTATCAPKVSYTSEELAATYALVGKICTVTDRQGNPQCNVRHLDVYETTFGHPDPKLVKGEGDGDNVAKFQADHIKAWGGMAADGIPLSDDTILVVEIFELVEVV